LREIAQAHSQDTHIVYPVHPNPNVTSPVRQALGRISNITLLPPLDYFSFVHLLKQCYLVLTDSGGIQEEAPSLGKPVLILRDTTERPEAVHAGTASLVGTESQAIVSATLTLLSDEQEYSRYVDAKNPFGDGHAAERIVEALQ
jgi:UDP-N-acetylglucosamine 2-epimerase (non-hydrolysing)